MAVADFVEAQIKAGFRPAACERLLRSRATAAPDGGDRCELVQSEVIEPAMAAGRSGEEISATDFSCT